MASPVGEWYFSNYSPQIYRKNYFMDRLVQMESLPSGLQIFCLRVKCRQGIAVVGGTGSGKTTLLNALS